ncbi:MAG: histidine kinase [Bacteroidetes bacterium]|nr:histidine kinase [Bacteroidota bacterium]
MNKKWFYNNLVFRLLSPFLLGIVVYMLVLLFFDSVDHLVANFFSREVLFVIVLSFVFLEINRLLVILLNHIDSPDRNLRVRVVLQLLASAILTVLIVSFFLYFYFIIFEGFRTIHTELITFNLIYLFAVIAYHLYYFSFVLLYKRNASLAEEENRKKANVELEIETLKYRVNQHFLFQSLEIIISELHRDKKVADALVDNLAQVYRFILDTKDAELIPVMDEIESLQPKLKLLDAKYKDSIRYAINTDSPSSKYVIPGSLQLLLENAVLENIITDSLPLSFAVDITENQLVINHTLNKSLQSNHLLEKQISRLKKAYHFYSSAGISMEENLNFVRIGVPLIELEEEKI